MNSIKKSAKENELDFKGLESLLRKSFSDKQLKVIDFAATKLLPAGENYCSIIIKLDASIKRGKSLQEEKLHLIAKTVNPNDKNPAVRWADVFEKEAFIYSELFPAYRDLERKIGIEEKDLINILPKYIGHRRTLKDIDDVVDEDSLILMENIKVQGYDTENRLKGMFWSYK